MGVYISGMEMPPSCRYCEFRHMSLTQNAVCTAANETIDYMAERTKRLDNCPLIPVPPHVRPVVRGKWLGTHDGFYYTYSCSECGYEALYKENTKDQVCSDFCPHCGARMDV